MVLKLRFPLLKFLAAFGRPDDKGNGPTPLVSFAKFSRPVVVPYDYEYLEIQLAWLMGLFNFSKSLLNLCKT